MLKKNGYQESIISKIFKRISNNHRLSQSQQQMQTTDIREEEIRMIINLPHVEGTSEKLWRILKSHKIRSLFYTESTFQKLLSKLKGRIATKHKNNIVHEINCSNFEAVYFRSLKSRSENSKNLSGIVILKRMRLQNIGGKQIRT